MLIKIQNIDEPHEIVDKCNETYHGKIKMNPADAMVDIYIDHGIAHNKKDPKFKVGDHLRILKHKSIVARGYTPNWPEEVFVIKKVKNTVLWIYIISNLIREKIVETFYEKS